MAYRLARRAGRRGAFLSFVSILDFSYGYALLEQAVAPLRSRPDLLLPLTAWGWIWISAGVVCASGVLARRDRVQFAAVAALKTAWGALYAELWIIRHAPDGWVSMVVWLSFAVTILIISGWPENPPGARP